MFHMIGTDKTGGTTPSKRRHSGDPRCSAGRRTPTQQDDGDSDQDVEHRVKRGTEQRKWKRRIGNSMWPKSNPATLRDSADVKTPLSLVHFPSACRHHLGGPEYQERNSSRTRACQKGFSNTASHRAAPSERQDVPSSAAGKFTKLQSRMRPMMPRVQKIQGRPLRYARVSSRHQARTGVKEHDSQDSVCRPGSNHSKHPHAPNVNGRNGEHAMSNVMKWNASLKQQRMNEQGGLQHATKLPT